MLFCAKVVNMTTVIGPNWANKLEKEIASKIKAKSQRSNEKKFTQIMTKAYEK